MLIGARHVFHENQLRYDEVGEMVATEAGHHRQAGAVDAPAHVHSDRLTGPGFPGAAMGADRWSGPRPSPGPPGCHAVRLRRHPGVRDDRGDVPRRLQGGDPGADEAGTAGPAWPRGADRRRPGPAGRDRAGRRDRASGRDGVQRLPLRRANRHRHVRGVHRRRLLPQRRPRVIGRCGVRARGRAPERHDRCRWRERVRLGGRAGGRRDRRHPGVRGLRSTACGPR